MLDTDSALLVIAGGGSYPRLLIAGARAAGVRRIAVLALRGQTARGVTALADEAHVIGVGEVEAGLTWAASRGMRDVMLVGQIAPSALFRSRFDATGRALLRGLVVKSAHTIFGALSELLTRRGLRVLPASCYMDALLPAPGVLTARAPDARETADITHGHRAALALGTLDIGQTVVVKEGMVLAVEAFEGTNATILRGGRLGRGGAVVVKVARDGHDMRFDIPAIGRRTLPVLRRAGIGALAFQARRTLLFDREIVIATADRLGIAIVALESGLPAAPARPGGQ